MAAAPEQGFDSFILRGRDAYELGRLVAARTLALGSCVPREGIVTHAVTIVCSGLKGHQTVRERRGLRSRQVEQAQRATSCRARGKGEASIDLQQSKRGAPTRLRSTFAKGLGGELQHGQELERE